MAQAVVNFRIDADLKRDMEKLCKELGLNMSSAFTIFARKMTRERRIPFEVGIDFYSDANMKHLERSIEQINSGKVVKTSLEQLEASV
ncbi:MAG: type II toxin-antitoxin system RelB/DinJ family antitoxin [Phascolarctobacterium sp.]|nr:type II toxin-antitoxin system RelB/DinJ family antitoxin [Candidatus Phascolarctobacterium caballi]